MAHGHGVDGFLLQHRLARPVCHTKHISEVTGVNDYGPFKSNSDDVLSWALALRRRRSGRRIGAPGTGVVSVLFDEMDLDMLILLPLCDKPAE